MARKTADFLADCFEHYADEHRPYIYGTYGMVLTVARLEWCAKTYPTKLSPERVKYAKEHYIGKRTDDCVGGEKNVFWLPGTDPDADPIYDASTDWSADTTYSKATVKGTIGSIPKRRGICVYFKGHTGVLTDPKKGIVCEFRGFDYGCVRTKLNERKWTHWFQHPLFDYDEPEPIKRYCKPIIEVLEKGAHGDAVKILQFCLNLKGYSLETDGSFGSKTDEAVRDFQKKNKISNPGVVGVKTWTLLFK